MVTVQKGDILLTEDFLPNIDSMLFEQYGKRRKLLIPAILRRYLELLELMVVNERLVVFDYDPLSKIDPGILKIAKDHGYFEDDWELLGMLDVQKVVRSRVAEEKILFSGKSIVSKESTPEYHAERYLSLSSEAQRSYQNMKKYLRKLFNDDDVIKKIALADITRKYGRASFISEYARSKQIPYILTPEETSYISQIEAVEVHVKQGVTKYLLDKMNTGVVREIRRLEEFGVRTIFPETPIASRIVMESNKIEDFHEVALELRKEFKSFRKEMVELETELASESTSLNKKVKLVNQIDELATALCPSEQLGLRKEALPLSGFLNIIPMSLNSISITDAAKMTQFVLSKPLDLILESLKRRKIRVLFSTRRKFMRSKLWTQKLAKIFGMSPDEIQQSLTAG